MTKSELKAAVLVVANATSKTEEEITSKLMQKDSWTWFLVREASE